MSVACVQLSAACQNLRAGFGIEEPKDPLEPGVFLVLPDQTLYYVFVQTMPSIPPVVWELIPAHREALIRRILSSPSPARGFPEELGLRRGGDPHAPVHGL